MTLIKKKQIPNFLTVLRIVLVPFFVFGFYFGKENIFILTFSIFLFATITDYLDGYLARKWKIESDFGKLFDPMADKILTISAMFMLVQIRVADVNACIIIALREFCIPTIREYYSSKGVKFPTLVSAKYKTAFNMIAILLLLGSLYDNSFYLFVWGNILLWVTALLAVLSGYFYILIAQHQLSKNGKKRKG
ncbi:MAG: CDP-diacylglycerol--glycerol-3-phosphate 3-phosphatidyltransferase [Alphaproteobacteria bacterium]|jgi:CDP-diacylglycerol--glycerol-3-phosphate 3-phosphatidyltransferase